MTLIHPDRAVEAAEWSVGEWFNHAGELSVGALRGRVVALHAFQILCPGCVSHGVPQAQRIRATFAEDDVAVVGLHSVFEHHDAMGATALRAFLHEYRVTIPVGIDAHDGQSRIPITMRAYGMQGTPTLILIDHVGRVRMHNFGRPEDMLVGASIASLVMERVADAATSPSA